MRTRISTQQLRTGALAWWGVALALTAQLGTSAHLLLVEHELCDAHGALVELDGDHHEKGSDDSGHDGDVHCPLAVTPSATLAPDAVSLSGPPALLSRTPSTPWSRADIAPLAILRVAPKTDPPTT